MIFANKPVSLAQIWNHSKETGILKCFKRGLVYLQSLGTHHQSAPGPKKGPGVMLVSLIFPLPRFSAAASKCLEDTSAGALVTKKVNPLRRRKSERRSCL